MDLNPAEIRTVLEALANSPWDEATVTVGETTIAVSRNGASLTAKAGAPAPPRKPEVAPMAVSAAAPANTPVSTEGTAAQPTAPLTGEIEVTSPTVGVMWQSAKPGLPPFVEVGTEVRVGDTLCIIEVMKLMNNITAEIDGVITAVLVDNAVPVEFGTPLFRVVPKV